MSTRAPSLGRGCRAQRGRVGFLFGRRSPLLFAFPIWERGPRSDALVYDALETIFSLSFISLVPYPPLWGTFPSRGRLCVRDSGALVNDALETIFFALFHPARTLSAPPSWHLPPWGKALCRGQRHSHKCRACILRKQKPLCEDWLCRAVSGSIILRSRILRDFSAYPHHFLS